MPPIQGTTIASQPEIVKSSAQIECEAKGGKYDLNTQTCVLPEPKAPTPKELEGLTLKKDTPETVVPDANLTTPEFIKDEETGNITGVTLPDGSTFFGTPKEINEIVRKSNLRTLPPAGTVPLGTAQRGAEQLAAGQQLAAQVGQIGPSTGLVPTDLSQTEALTQGVVNSIPSAIRLAGGAAIAAGTIGAVAAPVTGGLSIPAAAAIGGAIGFIAGIAGGMISNFNSQRTDNTNAQQRVLDEGKQTLMDWVTLSKADPANRNFYLKQFNNQLQLIQDAHVQMLTDTNADLGKFESAVPNLAEFDSFYSEGGERDALLNEMRNALLTPSDVNYELLALTERMKPE